MLYWIDGVIKIPEYNPYKVNVLKFFSSDLSLYI